MPPVATAVKELDKAAIMAVLETIPDPEIPVLTITDLGIVRGIEDDPPDLLVDRLRCLVGHILLAIDRITKKHFLVGLGILQWPECIRHAPAGDHVAGETGRIADVR